MKQEFTISLMFALLIADQCCLIGPLASVSNTGPLIDPRREQTRMQACSTHPDTVMSTGSDPSPKMEHGRPRDRLAWIEKGIFTLNSVTKTGVDSPGIRLPSV